MLNGEGTKMIIECISDLHGHYPQLEGGDLLIVAGDLTARDSEFEYADFAGYLNSLKYNLKDKFYKKIIIIAGNHDNKLFEYDRYRFFDFIEPETKYLCDREARYGGLRIWGSPWTMRFPGENPNCWAFTCETEEELAEKWAMIPGDTDILVTHSPPYGLLDKVVSRYPRLKEPVMSHEGSISLMNRMRDNLFPKLWVWGHIHEGYGQAHFLNMRMVNASHVNERYEAVNKPVRVEL